MLLGFEGKFAPVAPLRDFDIPGFVLAFRHVLGGQVGKAREQVVQFARERAVLLFHLRHMLLDLGDLGLERLGLCRVALTHRLADRLRGVVAAALRLLQGGRHLAAAGVEGEDGVGLRLRSATGQPRVESAGVLTDKGDIVHGVRLCPLAFGLASPMDGGAGRAR